MQVSVAMPFGLDIFNYNFYKLITVSHFLYDEFKKSYYKEFYISSFIFGKIQIVSIHYEFL